MFEDHLRRLRNRYVSLHEALEGKGHALTIDDATYGGFHAAMMARKYGHPVAWFINGMNVERKLPYFPFQFSWLLDETQKGDCWLDGNRWDLNSLQARRALRLRLKQLYMRLEASEQVSEFVNECSNALQVDPSGMEQSLCTVTELELSQAAEAGVELQNHGWGHLNPQRLTEGQLLEDIAENERYLLRFQAEGAKAFAPPFGRNVGVCLCPRYTLLADRTLPGGPWSRHGINRSELSLIAALTPACLATHRITSLLPG